MAKDFIKDEYNEHRKYLRGIRNRGKSTTAVPSGVYSTEFDPHSMTPDRTVALYRQLLGGVVQDPEMLDLVINNIEKFKHNFTFETTIYGDDKRGAGHTLATIKDIGHRTIQTYLYDYLMDETHLISAGAQVDSNWQKKAVDHLNIPGNSVNVYHEGTIRRVEVTVRYTKGMK